MNWRSQCPHVLVTLLVKENSKAYSPSSAHLTYSRHLGSCDSSLHHSRLSEYNNNPRTFLAVTSNFSGHFHLVLLKPIENKTTLHSRRAIEYVQIDIWNGLLEAATASYGQ